VEFALIFPIFMTIVLAMFTGAIVYNQDLSINHASREGARYAATLTKLPGGLGPTDWREAVRDRVLEAVTNDLNLANSGNYICVALVKSDGTTVWSDGGVNYGTTFGLPPSPAPAANCYSDGLTDTVSRVHVLIGRPGKIEALFYNINVNLTAKGTARYEP
jgi:Flp pilus assembly protein TadG